MIVPLEVGERLLRPYLPRIAQAIQNGQRDLNGALGDRRYLFKPRSLSSGRNDCVINSARRIFEPDDNVWFESRQGRDIMYIRDEAVIFFKKLDRSRRTRNIPTLLAQMLFSQQELPDMPPATPRFVAGWQMDSLGIAIQTMLITHPNAYGYEWFISLDDYGPAGMAVRLTPGPRVDSGPPSVHKKATGDADERSATSG